MPTTHATLTPQKRLPWYILRARDLDQQLAASGNQTLIAELHRLIKSIKIQPNKCAQPLRDHNGIAAANKREEAKFIRDEIRQKSQGEDTTLANLMPWDFAFLILWQ